MQIKFLGTGSAGNAIVIQSAGVTIMFDCGIPKTMIEKRLMEHGVNPGAIDAIFLTHEHGDHIKGLPLVNKWNIPIYASEGTCKGLNFPCYALRSDSVTSWGLHNLDVGCFRTHHNTYESFGYTIMNHDEGFKASICLDTGKVDLEMVEAMRGSTHIIIESNHCVDKVVLSDYPEAVKARNLGDLGHLSNDQTAEALTKIVQGKGERIYLAHLSKNCNNPRLAKYTVENALEKKGLELGKHFTLEVV